MQQDIFSFLGIYHQIHNKLTSAYPLVWIWCPAMSVIIFISNMYLSISPRILHFWNEFYGIYYLEPQICPFVHKPLLLWGWWICSRISILRLRSRSLTEPDSHWSSRAYESQSTYWEVFKAMTWWGHVWLEQGTCFLWSCLTNYPHDASNEFYGCYYLLHSSFLKQRIGWFPWGFYSLSVLVSLSYDGAIIARGESNIDNPRVSWPKQSNSSCGADYSAKLQIKMQQAYAISRNTNLSIRLSTDAGSLS